jgi:leucyl aminopeptidase (aminopeptidase T)
MTHTQERPDAEPGGAKLLADAELVVDVCFSVEKDDVVTIITDDANQHLAAVVADVAARRGARPVVMNNEQQVRRALADTLYPMAPPSPLHQAMVNSDEIIIITNLEWANRFAHTAAVKESCAHNAKIASVEGGMGSWPLTVDDIHQAKERAIRTIRALEGKKRVRVRSDKGTDVTVCIEARPALEVTPIRQRGWMMGPLPLWAEVAFAAVEDQTEGQIVVDGNMLGIGVDVVSEPIVWTVRQGKAIDIAGGVDARNLRQVIEGVPNVETIGEFAFGTSLKSPLGSPSEKGRLGNVHFALGDNHSAYPGGQNVCRLHLDGVVRGATLQILDTGEYIFKDGEWAL